MSVSRNSSGFTLIELAVVLIIIGLLTGGVFTGQSMLQNARLASIGTGIERFRQATGSFQSQYQQLPGDFTGAVAIWSTDASCPNTSYNSVAKILTCNGTGDGTIAGYERFRYWQHLSNAQLIDGSYSGTADASANGVAGVNVPELAIKNSEVLISYLGTTNGDTALFDDQYGHAFILAGSGNIPLLTVEEAKNMDKKYDDGMAATGTIKTYKYSLGVHECIKSDNSDYNATNTSFLCQLIFNSGF